MGRSECPKCGNELKWHDLIPILSFVLLRGRCRYCHKRISKAYPLIELATGLSFSILFLKIGLPFDLQTAYAFIMTFFLLALVFFDFRYYILPDKIVIPLIVVTLCIDLLLKRPQLINLLTSGLLLGGLFAILHIVSKGEWVGLGDAKLLLLIGLYFGYPSSFLITVLSIWSAALIGLFLIILKRANLKSELPFGVFLSIFSIVFIIFQNEIQTLTYFFY